MTVTKATDTHTHASSSCWTKAVKESVYRRGEKFYRVASETKRLHAGDSNEGTVKLSTVRSWIYQDVHIRSRETVAFYCRYADLPVTESLRSAVVGSPGWRVNDGILEHNLWDLRLITNDCHIDGFAYHDGEVDLPRLRCGTAPGWLTISGKNGQVSKRSLRIYLPGVDLGKLEELVWALDSSRSEIPWSLKSSIAMDRDSVEIFRADRTVVYLEPSTGQESNGLYSLVKVLTKYAPEAPGPGFSIKLSEGVYFGGVGNEYSSFGTRVANIAAHALFNGDFSPLSVAESSLKKDVIGLGLERLW